MADTPEQIAYDEELAKIRAMPFGSGRTNALDKFYQKYPTGRPGGGKPSTTTTTTTTATAATTVAATPEQIAYDEELAKIRAMAPGSGRTTALDNFYQKYPNGRPVSTATTTTASTTKPFSEAEALVAGQAFGFLKQFLDKFPNDLKLKEAWALLLQNDIAGAKLAFQASDYYKNTLPTSDSRLKNKLSRYGVYQIEFARFLDEQIRRLTREGIKLDPNDPKVKELFEAAYLAADTDNQIDIKVLAFNKGKAIGGSIGGSMADLRSYAMAFGIKYGDKDYQTWSEQIFDGSTTVADIQAKIRQDSASAFPMYQEQILNGASIDSIGSAYKSSYANILEVDADSIDWTDPLLRKALQYTVNGKPEVMPLWQFERELRKDARWQYTNQARESVYNAIYQVKTDMGLM